MGDTPRKSSVASWVTPAAEASTGNFLGACRQFQDTLSGKLRRDFSLKFLVLVEQRPAGNHPVLPTRSCWLLTTKIYDNGTPKLRRALPSGEAVGMVPNRCFHLLGQLEPAVKLSVNA